MTTHTVYERESRRGGGMTGGMEEIHTETVSEREGGTMADTTLVGLPREWELTWRRNTHHMYCLHSPHTPSFSFYMGPP